MMFTCIRVLNRLVVKGGLYVCNTSSWDKQAAGWAKTNKLAKVHGAEFCYGYGPQHRISLSVMGNGAESLTNDIHLKLCHNL
jgi:hypothetical protein